MLSKDEKFLYCMLKYVDPKLLNWALIAAEDNISIQGAQWRWRTFKKRVAKEEETGGIVSERDSAPKGEGQKTACARQKVKDDDSEYPPPKARKIKKEKVKQEA